MNHTHEVTETNAGGETIVFVVDDNEGIRTALSLLIEAHGWSVRCFGSAGALVDSGADTDCDCLVLDLHMPEMDGATLMEHLQARGRALPTIVLTSYPDGTLAARARAAGARVVLSKPVGVSALVEAIRRLTSEWRPHA